MAKKRRSLDEVRALVEQVNEHIAGGSSADAACDKVGLARSVYRRHKKANGGAPVVRGSVRADSLPPRPRKHGGKRQPKPLNLLDIGAVAHRIGKLDRKLAAVFTIQRERDRLAERLVLMLKPKKQ